MKTCIRVSVGKTFGVEVAPGAAVVGGMVVAMVVAWTAGRVACGNAPVVLATVLARVLAAVGGMVVGWSATAIGVAACVDWSEATAVRVPNAPARGSDVAITGVSVTVIMILRGSGVAVITTGVSGKLLHAPSVARASSAPINFNCVCRIIDISLFSRQAGKSFALYEYDCTCGLP